MRLLQQQTVLRTALGVIIALGLSVQLFREIAAVAHADELVSTPAIQPAPSATPAHIPWGQRPYEVRIGISFPHSCTLPLEAWCRQLEQRLKSHFGGMWNLTVEIEPGVMSVSSLEKLTSAQADAQWLTGRFDKVLRIVVAEEGSDIVIAGREWDRSSQSIGNLQQVSLSDRRDLPADLAALVVSLFRPLIEIHTTQGGNIESTIRAGEFTTANPDSAPITAGMFLTPYVRHLDKRDQVRSVQPVAWTYLEVESVDRARAVLKSYSPFRNPLPASRRRVEVLAMRVEPQWPSTEILIYPRGNRDNTLVGARCLVTPQVPPADQTDVAPQELMTDRRGIVTIPASPRGELKSLHVYSGTALLARVPILPGVVPRLELETPDDRVRLSVEGEVQLLEGELVDIMATREVLILRAKAAIENNNWEAVDSFLADLRKLPTQEQFFTRIEKIRLQAVQSARRSKDKVAEARIERLCSSVRESATKYLDPERIREFIQETQTERDRPATPEVKPAE
ncbi:hypothetical protein SH661x_000916 [Planctomicrobium sp. SH661]|uniref:hypothetical protein n=1 Tax=Planctomicrobium sp. SH661 TaxID=3448124 RepID=UPI003F5C86F7